MRRSRRAVKTVNGSGKKDGSKEKRSSLSNSSNLKPNAVAGAGKRINSDARLRSSAVTAKDRRKNNSAGSLKNNSAGTRNRKTAAVSINSARRKSSVVMPINGVVGTSSGTRSNGAIDSDRVTNNVVWLKSSGALNNSNRIIRGGNGTDRVALISVAMVTSNVSPATIKIASGIETTSRDVGINRLVCLISNATNGAVVKNSHGANVRISSATGTHSGRTGGANANGNCSNKGE